MFHITVINIFINIVLIKIPIVIILLILQTITHVSVLFVRICIDVARPFEGHASSTQAKTTALQGLACLVPASEFASWIIWDVNGNGLRLSLLLLRSLSLLALYDDIYIYHFPINKLTLLCLSRCLTIVAGIFPTWSF